MMACRTPLRCYVCGIIDDLFRIAYSTGIYLTINWREVIVWMLNAPFTLKPSNNMSSY